MTNATTQHPTVLGRRPLGNAEGVLIALRHCSADEAAQVEWPDLLGLGSQS